LSHLHGLTGLSKDRINSEHKDVTDEEFARLYVEFLVHCTDLAVVTVTNHNTGNGIQAILDYLDKKATNESNPRYRELHIFPGVEIGANDKCHILVIFNPATTSRNKYQYDQKGKVTGKLTWDTYIERFLDAAGVPSQRFDHSKPASSSTSSTCQILDLHDEWDFLPVFPHIDQGGGWNKELPENLRKDTFRHPIFGIVDAGTIGGNTDLKRTLSGQKDEYGRKVAAQIETSDARSISEIGSRFTWVKADPTFEGLRQILFEPVERVYVGDSPLLLKRLHEVIRSVRVTNAPDWFESVEIPLNSDLVGIIGGRGSGKSALLEVIALAGGSERFNQGDYTKDSFLAKACKKTPGNPNPLIGANVELVWQSGEVDSVQVPYPLRQPRTPEKVKYLPQKFVERLCDPENPTEIQHEMERVIFQRLDPKDRQGASSFDELRHIITEKLSLKKKKLRQSIQLLDQRIAEARIRITTLPEKEAELERKRLELKKLDEGKPDLPPESRADIEELERLRDLRHQVQRKISSRHEQLSAIEALVTRIDLFTEEVEAYNTEIRTRLEAIGLGGQIESFRVHMPPSAKSILVTHSATLRGEISTLEKGRGDEPDASLASLDAQIDAVNKRLQLTESKRAAFEKYQNGRQAVSNMITSLAEEIKEVTEAVQPQLTADVAERLERYLDVFDVLQEERQTLDRLYTPLRAVLQAGSDVDKKLTFASRINADLNQQNQRGLSQLLDRTRRGRYREETALGNALKDFFRRIEENEFRRDETRNAVSELYQSFLADAEGYPLRIADQLRDRRTERDFDDWFFNTELYSVSYSIKFENKDLELLSPGQKGIVLLLLYLEIEQEDNRPLLIDQPEENLDNVSIYDNLIEYFRKRKKSRQIIMITHNPNLVVNTDGEQVIVAGFDGTRSPRIEYRSGALENAVMPDGSLGIRNDVCKILEGGAEAFRRREQKYSLPPVP
jgi:ABC-type lipoprotein export system ATPase subunit